MEIKVGDQITIPFTGEQHLRKTGSICMVVQIEPRFVYVKRYDLKNQNWQKGFRQLDRSFVEKWLGGKTQ